MGKRQGTGGWKSLDMSCRVRERTRLGSSWGSQEDPGKPGHVSHCRKEKGGITGSERQRRRERPPLCPGRGRKKTPWKMVKITEVEEAERGRYWETPGRGRREEGQGGRRNC